MSEMEARRQGIPGALGGGDPGEELLAAVLALHHALAAVDRQAATSLGLSAMDHTCLEVIGRHPHIGPTELAERLQIPPTTMASRLKRLERDGWIQRVGREDDRRAYELGLSPTRQHEVHAHFSPTVARIRNLAKQLPDAPHTVHALWKLTDAVEARLGDEQPRA